jgi:4-amino-4-deoxy-L-arabinose transferase-like glycosyltransferase
LKFTAWPEMLLWPYLMIHGWLPYANIAIAHTPLMLVKLAIFYKIFGIGILQLKIFTWILIMVLDALVFWVSKKLWNVKSALIALSAFAFWQLFFDGNGLWFDLFMGVTAFISFYFVQKKRYLLAGIFWTLAFISKQTAVWFLIPIGLSLIKDYGLTRHFVIKIRDSIRFILGTVLVVIPLVLILLIFGILPSFIDWAVKFGIFILPKAEGQIQLPDLKNLFISVFPFLIFIPLIWKTGRKNLNLLLWTFAGVLGAYPRFEYFHFQPAIPFLAIATGLVLINPETKTRPIKYFLIFYILGSVILFAGFFMRDFNENVRFFETDVSDLVIYVKSNTKPGDKIFVMNWWDNIYPLTGTIPAVDPWVPQLSWYQEISGIQEKEVTDLKNSKPKLILFQDYADSGLASYVPEKVNDYVTANYKLKEKVDGIDVLIPK